LAITQILHHEEVQALLLGDEIDLRDVRVVQPGLSPSLPREAAYHPRVVRDPGRKHLERHGAFQRGVVGQVHRPHTAPAKQAQHLEVPQPLTDQGVGFARAAGIARARVSNRCVERVRAVVPHWPRG